MDTIQNLLSRLWRAKKHEVTDLTTVNEPRIPEQYSIQRVEQEDCSALNVQQETCSTLNVDCMVEVFKHLPIVDRVRLESVCKLWQEASRASWYNFSSMDFSISCWGELPADIITKHAMERVVQRCSKHITHIANPNSSFKYRIESTLALFTCPNLTSVDLTCIRVGVKELKLLTKNCDKITEFKLGKTTSGVDDDFLIKILLAKYTKMRVFELHESRVRGTCLGCLSTDYLEVLALVACTRLDRRGLRENLRRFSNLRTLSLCSSLQNLVDVNFQSLGTMNKLESLDLSENFVVFNDAALETIANNCYSLTTINLDDNQVMTDAGLRVITSLPNLKNLSISCTNVTGAGLSAMPKLLIFNCICSRNMEDEGVIQLLNNSKDIEEINLTECRKISNRVLVAALRLLESRTSDRKLKMVLKGTKIDPNFSPKHALLETKFRLF